MGLLIHITIKALLRNRLSLFLLIAAVASGVGFQVPNTANLDGYSHELYRKGVARDVGQISISPDGYDLIENASSIAESVRSLPFVNAVTVRLVHAGVLFRDAQAQPVRLIGLDPVMEDEVTGFCARVGFGECLSENEDKEIVIGSRVAEQLGVEAGEEVKLALPVAPADGIGPLRLSVDWYRVAGVLDGGGSFQADYSVFLPLANLQQLLEQSDSASHLSVFVRERHRIDEYTDRLQDVVDGARVSPWWVTEEFVANAIKGNQTLSAISMAMVILAVMIPVLALLWISVLQERRHIATLAAIGFDGRALFCIYLLKAALIGVVGVGIGVLVGFGLCLYFDAYPIFSQGGFDVRPVIGVKAFAVPSAVVFSVTVLAGLAPAVKAARANPALGLREE